MACGAWQAKARQRYSNFAVNSTVLKALGATLLFEVDATNLSQTLTTQLVDPCIPSQVLSLSLAPRFLSSPSFSYSALCSVPAGCV